MGKKLAVLLCLILALVIVVGSRWSAETFSHETRVQAVIRIKGGRKILADYRKRFGSDESLWRVDFQEQAENFRRFERELRSRHPEITEDDLGR